MKQLQKKSSMLIVIYTISIFIFSLAYNTCFHTEYQKVKDSPLLSDSYAVIRFNDNQSRIEKINQWAETANCHYVMTVLEWSRGKTVGFSEAFFRDMDIDTSSVMDSEADEDVAVVNENALDMCHETTEGLYFNIQGISYRVVATYTDNQDDKMYETLYYLNQNAKSLQDKKGYDYVLLDPMAGENIDTVVKEFQQTFPDTSVSIWNGNISGGIDNRPYFVLVTMSVAILLCINCIGFSNEWIKAQIREFGIRKLVGATDRGNHLLLWKRLLKLLLFSFVTGILLACFVLVSLNHLSEFKATRNLFGTYLYAKSAILAGGSVWLIGVILTELNLFCLRKRDILTNIRGGR